MDFVTFEIAKKLNEKGFDYETQYKYERNILAQRYEDISKPTISQVLKWLRSKKLIIVVNPEYFDVNGYCVDWSYDIWADDNYEHSFETYNTYESATLAAIEHCLNNLL